MMKKWGEVGLEVVRGTETGTGTGTEGWRKGQIIEDEEEWGQVRVEGVTGTGTGVGTERRGKGQIVEDDEDHVEKSYSSKWCVRSWCNGTFSNQYEKKFRTAGKFLHIINYEPLHIVNNHSPSSSPFLTRNCLWLSFFFILNIFTSSISTLL